MIEVLSDFVRSNFGQAALLAVVTALVGRWLTARGRLVWAVSHQHWYRMPRLDQDGTFPVITQQIWFQNVGRAAIDAVEIVLNWRPQHFEIWSPRQFETSTLADGRFVLQIPSLAGQEHFTISMIDTVRELPAVINVRSKAGVARELPMAPQRIWPTWFLVLGWVVLFVGAVTVGYLLLQAIIATVHLYQTAAPS